MYFDQKIQNFKSKQIWPGLLNPIQPTGPFLYPLKMSENQRFSDVFRGYKNGTLSISATLIYGKAKPQTSKQTKKD